MNLKELARKAVSTLFLSMLCLVAFAQTATGLVKDKTGEPMIGVNVLVKGTTNGTITDFDGKFSIPMFRVTLLWWFPISGILLKR